MKYEKPDNFSHEDLMSGELHGTDRRIYDDNFHPADFINQCSQGKHEFHILVRWNIITKTLTQWRLKFNNMHDAYELGKAAFTVYWIDFLKDNLVIGEKTSFNQKGWERIVTMGGVNVKDRMISLPDLSKAKTLKSKNKIIIQSLANQLITLEEAQSLQDLINKQTKLVEVQELMDKIELIEDEYGKR